MCKILLIVYQIQLSFKSQGLIVTRLKVVFLIQSDSCPTPVFPLTSKEEYIATAQKRQYLYIELQCPKSGLPFYNSGPPLLNKAILTPDHI